MNQPILVSLTWKKSEIKSSVVSIDQLILLLKESQIVENITIKYTKETSYEYQVAVVYTSEFDVSLWLISIRPLIGEYEYVSIIISPQWDGEENTLTSEPANDSP